MKSILAAAIAVLALSASIAAAAPANNTGIETAGSKYYVQPYGYPHIVYPWNPQPSEPCGPFNAYFPYCP